MHSIWSCDHCGVQLSANKIAVLQNVIGLSISKMDSKSPNQIIEFIENGSLVVSKNHHTIVQYKFVLLNLIGYVDPYKWSGEYTFVFRIPRMGNCHLAQKRFISL